MKTEAERVWDAWVMRCEFGSLGNRRTCTCTHCAAWRAHYGRTKAAIEAADLRRLEDQRLGVVRGTP